MKLTAVSLFLIMTRGPAEKSDGRSKLENAAQGAGCRADEGLSWRLAAERAPR